jgi:hypothetical protein
LLATYCLCNRSLRLCLVALPRWYYPLTGKISSECRFGQIGVLPDITIIFDGIGSIHSHHSGCFCGFWEGVLWEVRGWNIDRFETKQPQKASSLVKWKRAPIPIQCINKETNTQNAQRQIRCSSYKFIKTLFETI